MGKFRKMLLKTENLIALLHRHLLYFSIFSNLAPYVLTHWYARSWNVQISNVWVRIIRVIPKYYVLSIHVSTQHITWSYTVYIVCHTGWTHTVINTSLHSGKHRSLARPWGTYNWHAMKGKWHRSHQSTPRVHMLHRPQPLVKGHGWP